MGCVRTVLGWVLQLYTRSACLLSVYYKFTNLPSHQTHASHATVTSRNMDPPRMTSSCPAHLTATRALSVSVDSPLSMALTGMTYPHHSLTSTLTRFSRCRHLQRSSSRRAARRRRRPAFAVMCVWPSCMMMSPSGTTFPSSPLRSCRGSAGRFGGMATCHWRTGCCLTRMVLREPPTDLLRPISCRRPRALLSPALTWSQAATVTAAYRCSCRCASRADGSLVAPSVTPRSTC